MEEEGWGKRFPLYNCCERYIVLDTAHSFFIVSYFFMSACACTRGGFSLHYFPRTEHILKARRGKGGIVIPISRFAYVTLHMSRLGHRSANLAVKTKTNKPKSTGSPSSRWERGSCSVIAVTAKF